MPVYYMLQVCMPLAYFHAKISNYDAPAYSEYACMYIIICTAIPISMSGDMALHYTCTWFRLDSHHS